jgi:hypothetical protein
VKVDTCSIGRLAGILPDRIINFSLDLSKNNEPVHRDNSNSKKEPVFKIEGI